MMPILSSIFFIAALVLAVTLGPQTRPWSWGPAMMVLGFTTLAALPVIWKRGKSSANLSIISFAVLTTGWFSWRAWNSPAPEYAQADLLLLSSAVAAFLCVRSIAGHPRAERMIGSGLALLLLANLIVIGMQIADPSYSPIFQMRAAPSMISGFFCHYNEAANYLIAASLLVGSSAILGSHPGFVRVAWGLIAMGGLAGVWFTHSRGGILGASVGCGVFAAYLLVIGKRREAKWFAPALIAIPIMGLIIASFWLIGWQNAQEARNAADTSVSTILDNDCRLYFLGIAMSCIGMHPAIGGGSRSFTWECYRLWDNKDQGFGGSKPEFVHNELMQTATDYGLIGAGLLIGLLGTFILVAIVRTLVETRPKESDARDAWRLGAVSALAGMLVQSCFSFVFHLLPGVLLLGICLGQMSYSNEPTNKATTLITKLLITITALASAAFLLIFGWKGTQVTQLMWPFFSKTQLAPSSESLLDALSEAIQIWPHAELYHDRAGIYEKSISSTHRIENLDAGKSALADYHEATKLQPFDPANYVNLGNLASRMQLDSEAEHAYAKAIQHQGGMETAFRGHFSLANHLWLKGLRQANENPSNITLATLEAAAESSENATNQASSWGYSKNQTETRIAIHETLGTARESAGDLDGALKCYDFATKIQGGARVHYRAGVVIGKMAVAAWGKRKSSEAMALFIKAKNRVSQAGNQIPQEVTPAQRVEYLAYLDRSIAFLKGAKIEPKSLD